MKKILLISYHFPPSAEVGGLRIANFTKYLLLFGWNTYVLTIMDHYLKKVDTERFKDVETMNIFKTEQLPSIRQTYLGLKKIYFRILKRQSIPLDESENHYFRPNFKVVGKENISQKLKRYLISFITRPDLETNWILPAVLKAIREIRRKKIGYILTSCPPYSVHIIGLLVKRITGVKWIADFRDPWMTTVPRGLYVTCSLIDKIEYWLERKVIEQTDAVLTNTEALCHAFKNLYKKQPVNKFLYIPNGYNPEFFSKFKDFRKYKRFTLTYTGSFYLSRTPEPVFKALKELMMEGKLNAEDIRVNLVGNCQHVNGCPTSQIINTYGLGQTVHVLGQVSHHKALNIIKRSHLALLLAENQPFQIPAKVYDYIGLGTTILALTEEGATRDLINGSLVAGASFYPSDIDGIKKFILEEINKVDSMIHGSNVNRLSEFDSKVVTQKLDNDLKILMMRP